MTYEEMQKTMQFILEQQAQFTVDIQQLKESQAKTEGNVNQLTDIVAHFVVATNAGFQEVRGSISALVDAQVRNEENIRNLTAVVDRHFRDRNGRQDSA